MKHINIFIFLLGYYFGIVPSIDDELKMLQSRADILDARVRLHAIQEQQGGR